MSVVELYRRIQRLGSLKIVSIGLCMGTKLIFVLLLFFSRKLCFNL